MRSESNAKKRERRKEYLRERKRANDPTFVRQEREQEAARNWKKADAARPLHDVAKAPPTLTSRPKQKKPGDQTAALAAEQLAALQKPSPARQRILDEERERTIHEYRQRKRKAAE